MMKCILRFTTGFFLCIVAVGTNAVLAQSQPPPPTPVKPMTPAPQQAPQEYRVKQVLGSKVHIQGDLSIGTVDDIVFEDNGQIEYLIVLNDGKFITVPWQAAKFNFERRVAVVNITQEQYRVIPNFGLGLFPRFFTPEYRTETYRYYGLTPREARQIERRR